MPEITEATLKKQIDSGNIGCLYFLYGDETYLVRMYAHRFIDKVVAEGMQSFNLTRFDGTASANDITAAIETLPFMAPRRCVVIHDLNAEQYGTEEMNRLKKTLSHIPETTVVLLFVTGFSFQAKKSAKWKAFLSFLQKEGDTVNFARKDKPYLEKMLCTLAQRSHCDISRANAGYLIELCGNDMQTLIHEMEKLCAYIEFGEITKEIIEKVTAKNAETTSFILAREVLYGHYDKAYHLLHTLFAQKEEPIYILSAISASYIDLYRVKAAVQNGLSYQTPAEVFSYKGKEFRLNDAYRDSKNLSMQKLQKSIEVILETDVRMKSSSANKQILLEVLLARLLLIGTEETG